MNVLALSGQYAPSDRMPFAVDVQPPTTVGQETGREVVLPAGDNPWRGALFIEQDRVAAAMAVALDDEIAARRDVGMVREAVAGEPERPNAVLLLPDIALESVGGHRPLGAARCGRRDV